jgi:hypothetical protein
MKRLTASHQERQAEGTPPEDAIRKNMTGLGYGG